MIEPMPTSNVHFSDDVRSTFRAWRTNPMLVVASVLHAVLVSGWIIFYFLRVPGARFGLAFMFEVAAVATLVTVGYYGTIRVWYARAFAGRSMTSGEVVRLTTRFLPRFFTMAVALSVLLNIAASFFRPRLVRSTPPHFGGGSYWALYLSVFLIDVLFTFVTPALALTTPKFREAVKQGVAMLRDEWPASAPYAMAPALLLTVLGMQGATFAIYRALTVPLAFIFVTLVGLFVRGLTTAFFIRHTPHSLLEVVTDRGSRCQNGHEGNSSDTFCRACGAPMSPSR